MSITDYLNRSIEVFKTYNETKQSKINKEWMPTIIKEIGNMLHYYKECVATLLGIQFIKIIKNIILYFIISLIQ